MVGQAHASLVVQGGPNSGLMVPLAGRPVTFGRRADNDVVDDEATVSRKHALIVETPSGYVLRDLNTTNGTFLNRAKLGHSEQPLKHGDTIRFADSKVTYVFRHEGADTKRMSVDAPPTGAMQLGARPRTEAAAPRAGREVSQPMPVVPPNPTPAAPPQPRMDGKEAQLLRLLESKRGAAVSREEIARFVWPELPAGSSVNQEIGRAVASLRAEIEDAPDSPKHLITVGEFGYLLV